MHVAGDDTYELGRIGACTVRSRHSDDYAANAGLMRHTCNAAARGVTSTTATAARGHRDAQGRASLCTR